MVRALLGFLAFLAAFATIRRSKGGEAGDIVVVEDYQVNGYCTSIYAFSVRSVELPLRAVCGMLT